MNILQQQEALKDMSESQLVQEAKRPSGSVPSYMILSELNRRKDMRQRYQLNQTKPTATVAEEVITQTEQGLGSMMPRRQPQQMAARPQMPMQQSAIAQNQPMRMQSGGQLSIGGMSIEDIMKKIKSGEMKVPRGDSVYEEMDGPDKVSTMIGYNPAGEGDDASVYEVIRDMLLKPHPLEEDTNKISSMTEVISMNNGGVIRMQAGGDPSALSDEQLRQAIAAIQSAGALTAIQQDNLLRLQDELDVRNQITQNIMASNAQANKERRAALEGFIDDPIGSIGNALAGNPNLRAPSLRETSLARKQLQAEQSAELAQGMEEGRVGSTDPNPLGTQAELEQGIAQILETDPSLDGGIMQDPGMVQPYPGAPTMIAGQRTPNFRTEVPAVFDDADVPTMSVPDELVADIDIQVPDPDPIDEAQLYADAFADDPAPVTKTQESGGLGGLPLPLLLEAARFGADLADRGTRGENFLGSVAGAGKTSIDRGLKFAERQMKQQQLQNIANTKRRQGLEDFVLKEQIKRALEAPDTASISDINSTIRTFQSMLDTEQDPQKALNLKEKLAQLREDLERKTGIGGSANAQSVLQKAQAALAAQQARSS